MIVGIIRNYEEVDMLTCLTTRHGLREFECPVDTHLHIVKNKYPSVSTLKTIATNKCLWKLFLDYHLPLFVDPLDVYYMQRGQVFHEKLYENVEMKELPLLMKFGDDLLFGQTDGVYIDEQTNKVTVMDLKTKSKIYQSKSFGWNVPNPEDVLQVSIYIVMFEDIYKFPVEKIALYYHSWQDYVKFEFKADFDRQKLITDVIEPSLMEFNELMSRTPDDYEMKDGMLATHKPELWNIPEVMGKNYLWQCQYCPFWLICKHGFKTVTEHRWKGWGGITNKTFYSIVGYLLDYSDKFNMWGNKEVRDVREMFPDDKIEQLKWLVQKASFRNMEEEEELATDYLEKAVMKGD